MAVAEDLAWAGKIGASELPAEPLYRALLYSWVLSLFGLNGEALASVFSLCCHFLDILLVSFLAQRLWGV